MKLGVYNAILHDRPLPEALKVIADLGLTGIEINSGGFLPAVHIPTFDDILVSDTARDDYLGIFEGTGVSIAGLNCNGNPLHPNQDIGDEARRGHPPLHPARRPARPAPRRHHVRACPAANPAATRTNWIVNAWNSAALDVLDYQWAIAAAFWKETDKLARRSATSRSPWNCTRRTSCSTPPTCIKLVELTGATHVGVELDASHLFWQQMDPVAVVRALGPLVFQAAAKDVRVNHRIRRAVRRAGQQLPSAVAGRAPHQPRRRRMGQRVAQGTPRGTSSRSARGTTPRSGPSSCAPCTRSTPTCWSTSNTRTPNWVASRGSRWRRRC